MHTLKAGKRSQGCRNLFTELGFAYFGPVNGHDTLELEAVLRRSRALRRPMVVHVVTVKGKACGAAEADEADRFHAVAPAEDGGCRRKAVSAPAGPASSPQPWWRWVSGIRSWR
ncbi:1-deoxy-D-xylulose-5-phosphate synthase N-terminal domain-containing protein [Streptomyces sp. NPDC059443]|uniref:1-deoxy-D-xylulose-5-phosphate synthase N-terminal domain-containing protein n=1 Tax=unclassified Streptomyces TaxID=2593676 RepID=UPI00369F7861